MKQYDYLIVGAGLFGAVFAQEARKAGRRCLVIDRRSHIAGNVYTEQVEGINVHRYGAHIFHTNSREVWNYVGQFAEFNRYTNSPIANYHGEIYNMPFNMNTFNRMWGVVTPAEAKAKIEQQRAAAGITEPKNLEEQAISLVGTDIYEKPSTKSWSRATPPSSGAAPATSCPPSSSGGCRSALPTTTTISTPSIRASRTAATPPWSSGCWRVLRSVSGWTIWPKRMPSTRWRSG